MHSREWTLASTKVMFSRSLEFTIRVGVGIPQLSTRKRDAMNFDIYVLPAPVNQNSGALSHQVCKVLLRCASIIDKGLIADRWQSGRVEI